jgi:hypothetical protein
MAEIITGKNVLSADVEIKGSIKFQNELTIDGKVEGEITSAGILTVGENAEIRGEIKTKSVTVLGKVHGNITVDEGPRGASRRPQSGPPGDRGRRDVCRQIRSHSSQGREPSPTGRRSPCRGSEGSGSRPLNQARRGQPKHPEAA